MSADPAGAAHGRSPARARGSSAAEPRDRVVSLPGLRLFVREWGEGAPVLLDQRPRRQRRDVGPRAGAVVRDGPYDRVRRARDGTIANEPRGPAAPGLRRDDLPPARRARRRPLRRRGLLVRRHGRAAARAAGARPSAKDGVGRDELRLGQHPAHRSGDGADLDAAPLLLTPGARADQSSARRELRPIASGKPDACKPTLASSTRRP